MSRGWLQRLPNKGYDPPLGFPTPTSEKALLLSTRVNKGGRLLIEGISHLLPAVLQRDAYTLHTRGKVRCTGRLTTSQNTPLPPRRPGWVLGREGSCRMLRAGDAGPPHEREATMDWKLEVVPIPVSDVDRAKRFYSEQAGFVVDLDTQIGDGMRLVQLTPPGSGCSIHLSAGILNMAPGVLEGLLLVVSDIEAARAELFERGVKVGQVVHRADGAWVEGRGGRWNSFVFFSDPDGNGWVLQERPAGE